MLLAAGIAMLTMSCGEKGDDLDASEVYLAFLREGNTEITKYWVQVASGIEAEAKICNDANVKTYYTYGENDGDTRTQVAQIRSAWDSYGERIKGVIFASCGLESDIILNDKLKGHDNVKLVIVDSPLLEESPLLERYNNLVATDNYEAGCRIAVEKFDTVPSTSILLIADSTGNAAQQRLQGFLSCKEDVQVCYPSISDCTIEHISKDHPNAKYIFSLNAYLSSACVKNGLTISNGFVTGCFDEDDVVLNALEDGEISFTVVQNTMKMGQVAFDCVYKSSAKKNIYTGTIIFDSVKK